MCPSVEVPKRAGSQWGSSGAVKQPPKKNLHRPPF